MASIPCVSVVVPVYKTEQYIERCARSLFEQTLECIEYIFVNDCTPDGSMAVLLRVLEEYPGRKPFVKIIEHEENGGSAQVRNTGTAAATGEYIIHCDSDDWVERDMYEQLYAKAVESGADIVGSDFFFEYPRQSIYKKQDFALPMETVRGEECVMKSLRGELHCAMWNKLVNRTLYTKHGVAFPTGINMWEDFSTILRLYYFADKVAYVPRAFYHYVKYNVHSYCYALSEQSCRNLVDAAVFMENFFKDERVWEKYEVEMNRVKLSVKLLLLMNNKGKAQRKWGRVFPESEKYLFSYTRLSLFWRIALKCTTWNCFWLLNIGKWIKNR